MLRTFARRVLRRPVRDAHLPEININSIAPGLFDPIPPILDDICMPPYFNKGCFLQNDFGVLIRLLRYHQPTTVFEFGTAHGNTTANVCQVTSAHVYTLNALPEQISGESVTFTLSRDEIGRVYRAAGYADRVTQIYEDTMEFVPSRVLREGQIDFCIIDACHDTEFVLHDFLNIEPYISPGGTVVLHDTHPSRAAHLQGSYDACVSLRQKGFNILHIEDCWWGYWKKPV